jgi:hypothetical protein
VVERAGGVGILDEHELERRGLHGEVGVAGTALGRRGVEQLGVEGDGGVHVGHVEGELDTGHGDLQE